MPTSVDEQSRQQLIQAIEADNRDELDSLFSQQQGLVECLNQPHFVRGRPALAATKSVETAELLHGFGAAYDVFAQWAAPGFGVRTVNRNVGRLLAGHVQLSPHAMSALGLTDSLSDMLDAEPETVNLKGGDDGTPLHFARDLPTARLLVERGADLNARDTDHDSTPAQWLIGDAVEVARFLIENGGEPDIFVAAALGDHDLVQRLVKADPWCLSYRIGKAPFYPIGHQGRGGTILQWSLAFNSYAHQIAISKGHDELFQVMYADSDRITRFLVACCLAMRSEAESIAAEDPGIVASLPDEDKELVARYCWETNVHVEAVRLMLDLGFPLDQPETSHCFLPLHNAAWGGYGDLVDLLIERGAPVDIRDPVHGSTPLGHAIFCCTVDGRHPEGEYPRVVKALVEAGNPCEAWLYPTGHEGIDAVLKPLLSRRLDGLAVLGDRLEVQARLADTSPDTNLLTAALVVAAYAGHLEICDDLLEAGGQIALPEDGRWTPLHAAVAGGSLEAVEHLMQRGADIGILNQRGGTVWHTLAGCGGSQQMIDLLLKHGAQDLLNRPSDYGHTPLDLAKMANQAETADRLRALSDRFADGP